MPLRGREFLNRVQRVFVCGAGFLYASGLVSLNQPVSLESFQGILNWIGGLENIRDTLASNGITLEVWNKSFGSELSWIGEWPASMHWPAVVAILAVKDPANANKILNVIAANRDSEAWKRYEKDGVQYLSAQTHQSLFAFSPTIGLSDRMLVAGADAASVEVTMKRASTGNSELAGSKLFLKAESAVPRGKQAFAYVDPALIYTRLDETLRPIVLMSAAFLPGIVDNVDVNKLPPTDVITKHLSPIVMSQSYDGKGYIAESVGPITFGETIIAIGGLGGVAGLLYEKQIQKRISQQSRAPVTELSDRVN